jgi:hypothetical protein
MCMRGCFMRVFRECGRGLRLMGMFMFNEYG